MVYVERILSENENQVNTLELKRGGEGWVRRNQLPGP